MYSLDTFRSKCDVLLKDAVDKGDQVSIDKYSEIKSILSSDDCFRNVDNLFIVYVLDSLGYNIDQINEFLDIAKQIELFDGILEYTDNNGNLVQIETLVNPEFEGYYKFNKGPIFKYNSVDKKFYMLVDNTWIYDGGLERRFEDSGSDYVSIDCFLKEDSLRRR